MCLGEQRRNLSKYRVAESFCINTLPIISLIKMGFFTARYYEQVKDYLYPDLHDFFHYYRQGNVFDLPLYHGCNKKNRNGTSKLIEYNQGHQCIVPTNKLYWRKTKDKYKRIG